MEVELPDANVLISLFDSEHQHHSFALNWFDQAKGQGWATCPLTENAVVRIVSGGSPLYALNSVSKVAGWLCDLRSDHADTFTFIDDTLTFCDATLFNLSRIQGHKQLTDLYLLGLCQRHNAVLVTFEARLADSRQAIINPRANLIKLLATK